jgi:CRP-like cAMP-binding protein
MDDLLRQHIIKRLGSDIDNIDFVLRHFKPVALKRGEQVLKEGEVCRYVYYVAQGCLQVYVHDQHDNENTRDIVIEDNWCSELMSFGTQKPATENIRAVEDTTLLAIDHHNFGKLMEQVPQFDKVYRQILEQSYANSVYRINTFVALSALERIQWLVEYRPSLMTRLPGKLIASYLGINKDVFSRLRSQI